MPKLTTLASVISRMINTGEIAALQLTSPNKRSPSKIAIIPFNGTSYVVKLRNRRSLKNSFLFLHGLWEERFIWRERFRNFSDLLLERRRDRELLLDNFWWHSGLPARKRTKVNIEGADVYYYIAGNTLSNLLSKEDTSMVKKRNYIRIATRSLEKRHRLALVNQNPLYIPTDVNPHNIIVLPYKQECAWIDSENCVDYNSVSVSEIAVTSLKWFILQLVDFSKYIDFKLVLKEIATSYDLSSIRFGLVKELERVRWRSYFKLKSKAQLVIFGYHPSHRYDLYPCAIDLMQHLFLRQVKK